MTDPLRQPDSAINDTRRRAWYQQMVEIRVFEDKVQELFFNGLISGTTHLCQGQEAVSVGAISVLGSQDYVTMTYRGHGQALARGMSMETALAELMGREPGCCHGLGGSMHLTDFRLGLIGSFAIVGAGMPVAVGAAMSSKLRGDHRIALSFVGDGATNIGTFHESMNMAAVWRAPVVFVIENNLYGEYTPMRDSTPIDDLAERARAYGMPGAVVDGQDVEGIYVAVSEAANRAREGGGPTLLEMKTYRYKGHSRSDPARYRPQGELEAWIARDPIELLGRRLSSLGLLTESQQGEIRERAENAVERACARALEAAFPSLEALVANVYAD